MTVVDLLARQDRTAIAVDDLTHGDLDLLARRWVTVLRERGVIPGDRVAVSLPRGVDALALAIACWSSRAVFVPVDPTYPDARVKLLMGDAKPSAVFTVEDRPGAVPADPISPLPTDPAYVIYTSGSTGRPKGVVVSHGAFGHYVSCAVNAYPGATGLSPWHSTLGFDATITSVWVPLAAGGRVHVIPESTPLSGVEGVADLLVSDSPVGLLKITPSQLAAVADWLDGERPAHRIGTLVLGGEQVSPSLVAPWLDHADLVVNEYGPTETTVGVTYSTLTEKDSEVPLSVGHPFPGTKIHLLDADGNPADEGEICVAGPQLADGYLNAPEATRARFRTSPLGRLYHTGDLGRWADDGGLRCLGRLDDQLKHRGHRIEPGEIEAVLHSHPGVRHAVVFLREDRLLGYASRATTPEGRALTPRDLRAHLKTWLPRHLVPDEVLVFDELPLTGNGKLDRSAITP
ncbi:amino acid adenylation domain-containing protein [Actinokineospora globicatena]|uniref:Amino acid adenylation domain-containing protein n=1 Tax=Actinokineospora globicatena TaxID=103729 RepID=A0A9W6QGA2_9PSEU|nr:amino acid adenylation domain-containing protein [Actinokineospora globicatena]GLW90451.1 hypothetical protein Aglo03_12670 [Actinokineospora globicatena]